MIKSSVWKITSSIELECYEPECTNCATSYVADTTCRGYIMPLCEEHRLHRSKRTSYRYLGKIGNIINDMKFMPRAAKTMGIVKDMRRSSEDICHAH